MYLRVLKIANGGVPMYEKKATIVKQIGLHARPATFLIQKANEFKSSIWIEKDERRVNAKSLLGVLSLGVAKDTTINIIAEGPDEVDAVETLCELLSSDFEE
jgi:phosphocarrier protein